MPPRERRGEDRGLDVGDLGEFIGGILRGAKDAQVVEHRQEQRGAGAGGFVIRAIRPTGQD